MSWVVRCQGASYPLVVPKMIKHPLSWTEQRWSSSITNHLLDKVEHSHASTHPYSLVLPHPPSPTTLCKANLKRQTFQLCCLAIVILTLSCGTSLFGQENICWTATAFWGCCLPVLFKEQGCSLELTKYIICVYLVLQICYGYRAASTFVQGRSICITIATYKLKVIFSKQV